MFALLFSKLVNINLASYYLTQSVLKLNRVLYGERLKEKKTDNKMITHPM